MSVLHSALYVGRLRHGRVWPKKHEIDRATWMLYLDLAEWDSVFADHWLFATERSAPYSIARHEFLGCSGSLDECVRAHVEHESGFRPRGPVRLLAMPRAFGVGFRPASFFYCFDSAGCAIEAVLVEVRNTPWLERHTYVLRPVAGGAWLRASCEKRFHVSPFFGMDLDYRFRFRPPGEDLRLGIACNREGRPVFDASLTLERRPLETRALLRAAARSPFPTGGAIAGIYRHALLLFARRFPFYPHPAKEPLG